MRLKADRIEIIIESTAASSVAATDTKHLTNQTNQQQKQNKKHDTKK